MQFSLNHPLSASAPLTLRFIALRRRDFCGILDESETGISPIAERGIAA
jgi:hypothetical protein